MSGRSWSSLLQLVLWSPGSERRVHAFRAFGAVLLGLVPAVAVWQSGSTRLGHLGAELPRPIEGVVAALLLFAVAVPFAMRQVRAPDSFEHYPQIRAEVWTLSLWLRNAATWSLYLVAYEFFFRGLLVFGLKPLLGPAGSVVVSAALYVFAHLHKGLGEVLGCVPMGLLFGISALWTGSFWPAFAAHLGIALVSEAAAIRAQTTTR